MPLAYAQSKRASVRPDAPFQIAVSLDRHHEKRLRRLTVPKTTLEGLLLRTEARCWAS